MAEGGGYVCGACGAQAATSDRMGICPSCKNGLLTKVAGGGGRTEVPRSSLAAPASSDGGERAKRVVLAIIVLGAIVALARFGNVAWDRFKFPSEPVVGDYASQHLGVTIGFEPGWRHLKKDDRSEHYEPEQLVGGGLDRATRARVGGADLHSSVFFRGRTSAKFDDGLYVGVLELQSAELRQALTQNLVEAAKAGAASAETHMSRWEVALGDCAPESVDGYTFARCTGTAAGEEEGANLVFYLYATGRGVGMVLLVSHDAPDQVAVRARALLLSMK